MSPSVSEVPELPSSPVFAPSRHRTTFSFGRNWQEFLTKLDASRVTAAMDSLRAFLKRDDLHGVRFLDVGCGSGLFSLAALRLGAPEIVSFDVDPDAVACAAALRAQSGSPPHWRVLQGSALDPVFLASLGAFDIVYAWGVLHHTGKMWDALANVTMLVQPGGHLYVALYNRVPGIFGSAFWLVVKRFYHALPSGGQRLADRAFGIALLLRETLRGKSPRALLQTYASEKRGMEWWTNVRDWLGGYPYECATVEDVIAFMARRFPDFRLVECFRVSDLRNNWFLFVRDVRHHRQDSV